MPFETILEHISGYFFDTDRLSNAFAAIIPVFVLGCLIGPLRNNCHPFIWIVYEAVFGNIGKRLDRQNRAKRDLMMRGTFVTLITITVAFALGHFLEDFIVMNGLGMWGEIAALSLTLTGGTVLSAQFKLYRALEKKQVVKGSYLTIAMSSRTDLNSSDDFGITRLGMGLTAHCFNTGMVAPVFWYFVAGLPGAYLYAGIAMLGWRFGREGSTKGFGKLALFLEKIMGYLPDMIAGFLISLAGLFTPTGGMTRALIGHLFGKDRAPYEQGGKAITALAYALKVNLGGPTSDLEGVKVKREWIGPDGGTAQLGAGHLRRAMYISFVAHILFLALIISAILWSNLLG